MGSLFRNAGTPEKPQHVNQDGIRVLDQDGPIDIISDQGPKLAYNECEQKLA